MFGGHIFSRGGYEVPFGDISNFWLHVDPNNKFSYSDNTIGNIDFSTRYPVNMVDGVNMTFGASSVAELGTISKGGELYWNADAGQPMSFYQNVSSAGRSFNQALYVYQVYYTDTTSNTANQFDPVFRATKEAYFDQSSAALTGTFINLNINSNRSGNGNFEMGALGRNNPTVVINSNPGAAQSAGVHIRVFQNYYSGTNKRQYRDSLSPDNLGNSAFAATNIDYLVIISPWSLKSHFLGETIVTFVDYTSDFKTYVNGKYGTSFT